VLITALCFTAFNRLLACFVRSDETGVYADIVLVDLSTNQHIDSHHLGSANYHASTVAYFGSEEAIMAGMHLAWVEGVDQKVYYDDYGQIGMVENYSYYILQSPDGRYHYTELFEFGTVAQGAILSSEAEAKRQQLLAFRNALHALENTEGLLYHIEIVIPDFSIDGMYREMSQVYGESNFSVIVKEPANTTVAVYSNVDENRVMTLQDRLNYFTEQPVFYLIHGDGSVEQSTQMNYTSHIYYWDYDWPSQNSGLGSILLAFTSEFVYVQNAIIYQARDAFMIDISIIAACIVLVLAMTVVLLIGAGRQYVMIDGERKRPELVHFSPIDKPYLDLGLAVVAGWVAFVIFIAVSITDSIAFHRNIIALNIVIAVIILLTVPPVLFWLTSLVKRLKAGRFWKHTLIYAIIYSCLYGSLRFLVRKIRSLWSGSRLTFRAVLIAAAAFFVMFFVAFIGAEFRSLGLILFVITILTAIIAVLLLMYARRLRNLETGAKAASEGNYDTPIEAGEGELGNIAKSINSISAGINTAVEERMKSERLKTELITNVSHDIRTPLTSIITYTDLLEHEGLDCEKAPDYLDILKQKSLRLKTLTEELFEAAKASTGNIDVNLTDLNVVSLINQVLGELDSSIKSSGIDLRVNLPEKLTARADGRLMQRVMENLLSNVFKYSLPNSRVYVDASSTPNKEARIDIKNISATELNFDPSELTERFKRGDDSRADGGSGLGLSIVQSFVTAQNGRFEITIDGDLFKATVLLPVLPEIPEIKK